METFLTNNCDNDGFHTMAKKPRERLYTIIKDKGNFYAKNFNNNTVISIHPKPRSKLNNQFGYTQTTNYYDKLPDVPDDFCPLSSIYNTLTNGNTVSPHAFTKKSEYINSLELEVKNIDLKLLNLVSPSIKETSTVVSVFRHLIVDLNLILMAFKSSIPAKVNGDWDNGKVVDICRKDSMTYQLDVGGNESRSTKISSAYTSVCHHIRNYYNNPEVGADAIVFQSILSTFPITKIKEIASYFVFSKKPKDIKRLKQFVLVIGHRGEDHLEMIKYILLYLNTFLSNEKQIPDYSGVEDLEALQNAFNTWKFGIKGSLDISSTEFCRISFPNLDSFKVDSLSNCLSSREIHPVEIKLDDMDPYVLKMTATQVYLTKSFAKSIKVQAMASFGQDSMFMLLDMYQNYKTKKNIQTAVSKIQKDKPDYTLNDLIEDEIKRMEASFDEFAISFTGKTEFMAGESVMKSEYEDFVKIDDWTLSDMDKDFSAATLRTDRQELWNLVFGGLKSHLSNKRKPGRIFYSSYTGGFINPMETFINIDDIESLGYMEMIDSNIQLKILNVNGEIELVRLEQYGKNLNLNDLKIKKKMQNMSSFVQIYGFSIYIRGETFKLDLEKPFRYMLPNENNVSPLLDPNSLILNSGYGKLYIDKNDLTLSIPISEKRTPQLVLNPTEYY